MDQTTISLEFKIPVELMREFELDQRVVIKHPWVIGIPAPERFLDQEWFAKVQKAGFQVMLVPEQRMG
jgi:hypothetical protein